jgi:hypothetical protein
LHQLSDANKADKHESQHEVIVIIGDDTNIREELEGLGMPIKNLVEDDFELD